MITICGVDITKCKWCATTIRLFTRTVERLDWGSPTPPNPIPPFCTRQSSNHSCLLKIIVIYLPGTLAVPQTPRLAEAGIRAPMVLSEPRMWTFFVVKRWLSIEAHCWWNGKWMGHWPLVLEESNILSGHHCHNHHHHNHCPLQHDVQQMEDKEQINFPRVRAFARKAIWNWQLHVWWRLCDTGKLRLIKKKY